MKSDPEAFLVIDLAFGDCGKGTVVDFLVRDRGASLVVRFNGGPQAGHNVVTTDRRHHTFAQFGSGTFVPGVRTLLSRFVLIEPYALLNEAAHLRALGVGDCLDRLRIDARCPVITPAHQAANRLRERARGRGAHGTCGLGVGEAVADDLASPDLTIRAGHLADRAATRARLREVVGRKREELRDAIAAVRTDPRAAADVRTLLEPTWVDAAVDNYAEVARHARVVDEAGAAAAIRASAGAVVFEGAQGVLLDEWRGFHPHTTWSTTTFANADALLDGAGFDGRRARVGVLRTYFTRHGPGPFVTEDPSLAPRLPEPHNDSGGWQGRFRVGAFDAVLARYALAVAGPVDFIALTHLDRAAALPPHVCTAYAAGDGTISTLRPSDGPDLSYQQRLTETLSGNRPIFAPTRDGGPAALVRAIERELLTPIGLTSSGPTAADKRWTDRRPGNHHRAD